MCVLFCVSVYFVLIYQALILEPLSRMHVILPFASGPRNLTCVAGSLYQEFRWTVLLNTLLCCWWDCLLLPSISLPLMHEWNVQSCYHCKLKQLVLTWAVSAPEQQDCVLPTPDDLLWACCCSAVCVPDIPLKPLQEGVVYLQWVLKCEVWWQFPPRFKVKQL